MVRSCRHHERYNSSDGVRCNLLGDVTIRDCSGCKSFLLKPQKPIQPTVIPDHVPFVATAFPELCQHLGTKLSVAPCCGQMFACNFHKGKKCVPVGIAKDPFLSCSMCPDFAPAELWPVNDGTSGSAPRVGFLSAAYLPIGGTETFHRTLIPRLRTSANVVGFVATAFDGGDGSLLQVPYETGIESARKLAAHADIVVAWGISDLRKFLPANRPKVIAVHHADLSSDWSNQQILSQLDLIDEIACVNKQTAAKFSECGKPSHYIPNALDPERIRPSGKQSELRSEFNIPSDSKIVLFGHRMSAEKRPLLAVEVAKNLPSGWVMVIAGDGPETDAVKAMANGCDKIRFVGLCDSLAGWLSISSCFLSLSTLEGFGLSIGESMLASVPTVSTPTGIAPGLAITLPTDSTASEWASAIVDSHTWTQPPELADRFSVERMVSSWSDVIGNLGSPR